MHYYSARNETGEREREREKMKVTDETEIERESKDLGRGGRTALTGPLTATIVVARTARIARNVLSYFPKARVVF